MWWQVQATLALLGIFGIGIWLGVLCTVVHSCWRTLRRIDLSEN
jgi:hypothetical protein